MMVGCMDVDKFTQWGSHQLCKGNGGCKGNSFFLSVAEEDRVTHQGLCSLLQLTVLCLESSDLQRL